jgi:3-methyl-2-oxobutanoate hydroxymethyltransferase
MDRPAAARKPLTLHRLRQMHAAGEPLTMLTCYDATFARLLDEAGVDCLLVGDSLGMVLQGRPSTLPVSLEEMAYHTRCVAAGNRTAWLIADLPFGSYQASKEQAWHSATVLMQAGAQMVKLEGGGWTADTVRFLVERGIPVCAHLGLTPQRCTRSAAGASRAATTRRPLRCCSTRANWPMPAPRCWCSS